MAAAQRTDRQQHRPQSTSLFVIWDVTHWEVTVVMMSNLTNGDVFGTVSCTWTSLVMNEKLEVSFEKDSLNVEPFMFNIFYN